MRTHRVHCALSILVVLFLTSHAFTAATILPPGWGEPDTHSTGQRWDPQPPQGAVPPQPGDPLPEGEPLPSEVFPPTDSENPFGEGSVSLGEGWEFEWSNPPGTNPNDPFEPIPTWHYNGIETGTMCISIPNSPEQRPMKYIWYAITADKAPSDAARPVNVGTTYDPPLEGGCDVTVTWVPEAYVSEQIGGSADGDVWYRYEGMAKIEPNPQSETLTFTIVNCTNIADIEVRTVCVPEPATMAVVGIGGLMILLKRKR